jgi:hypothetical protein
MCTDQTTSSRFLWFGVFMPKPPQTVIGIPGRWTNRSDIVASIATRSDGYLFAGMVMMKIETKDTFKLEIHEHDPNLKNAFAIAGRGRLTSEDLEAIGSHTFTLYLVADGGSADAAKKLMHAANALLKSGGIAVKIESAGTAHRADQWAQYCARDNLGALLQAYVTYVGGKGVFYSCGMHNMGYPDAVVEADISPNDAAKLLHMFLGYLLVERPKLNDGETFSIDAAAPRYRLFHEPCTKYESGNFFHNPFGVWKLIPAKSG